MTTQQPQGFWTYLNQPFTIWALSVTAAAVFVFAWQPYEQKLQRRAEAQEQHEKLHVEVKSRLRGLRDEVRDRVLLPEVRRSLDSGASANVVREMDPRSLRSLAMEHDELVASGRVHCPLPFTKGTEAIYESLRTGDSSSAAKTGVETLLSQLGGGSNSN